MRMSGWSLLASGALLLAGCGLADFAWRSDEGPLERVLIGADDTPANQGLLYVAMREAEAASQSAGRAVAQAGNGPEVETAVGEALYAVDPERAPAWDAKSDGIVPGWPAKGYGVQRAVDGVAAALRRAAVGVAPGERQEYLAGAMVCTENTRQRAAEVVALASRILATPGAPDRSLLPELHEAARALNQGRDANGNGEIEWIEGECGLQQAERVLDPLRPRRATT